MKLRFATESRRPNGTGEPTVPDAAQTARRLARQSCVLLKNQGNRLPLRADALKRVAVIGPLADAGRDQLGCWMLDGRAVSR